MGETISDLDGALGSRNEFIPYSDLHQKAKVIATEFKLEFQGSIHQRNANHAHSKTNSKITSCDRVTNSQKSMSTKGGPLNSAHPHPNQWTTTESLRVLYATLSLIQSA